jgi:hypothetical protein
MKDSMVLEARDWLMAPFLQRCELDEYINNIADIRVMKDEERKKLFNCMLDELEVKGFTVSEIDDIMSRNTSSKHIRDRLMAYYIVSNYDDFRNDRELYQVLEESNKFNTDEDFTEEDLKDIAYERRSLDVDV